MLKIQSLTASLLHKIRYNFIPPSCYDVSRKPNPVVCVTIGNNEGAFCDLHFRLFENVVPKTAENYKKLLLGTGKFKDRSLTLVNSGLVRYVPRAYIQFGNMQDGNCSIFGPKFRDQSFQLLHDRPGLLTSISEQNTNNSRFAVTLAPSPYMDLKNVVFGQITADTFPNLRELQKLGARMLTLRILSSQLLKQEQYKPHFSHQHATVYRDEMVSNALPATGKNPHHDHHHDHHDHHHEHSQNQQFQNHAHIDGPGEGHHGLKHSHKNH